MRKYPRSVWVVIRNESSCESQHLDTALQVGALTFRGVAREVVPAEQRRTYATEHAGGGVKLAEVASPVESRNVKQRDEVLLEHF